MTQKSKLIGGVLLASLVSPVFALSALAETTVTSPSPIRVETRAELDAQRVEARKEIEARQGEIKDARQKLESDMKQKKDEIKDLRASTTKDIQEKRGEIRNQRAEIRGEEAMIRVTNVSKMLTANANRLDNIILRIDSRVAKIKTAGGNTTAIEAEIATAKTDMASVRTHINIISSLDLSGASTTVKANFEQAKSETKIVKDLFAGVRKNLEKIVSDLRVLGKEMRVRDEAPKTEETSSTTPNTAQ